MKEYARTTTLLKIAGPKTFRLGSTKLFDFDNEAQPGYGGNLQNIEKSARRKFEADEGKLLCQNDQSGADALIVAYLMPAGNALRELFINGIKIHVYLGVMFPEQWEKDFPMVREFRALPIKEVKKHPNWDAFRKAVALSDDAPAAKRYYYHYKKVGHSANYGAHAGTVQEAILLDSEGMVRLTKAETEKYLKGYHSLIPELRANFHKYIEWEYEHTGVLHTMQGFPITLTQKVFPHQYSKIYDKVPQATVAIITHQAVIAMQNFIEEHHLKWDILTNTHDSYLVQAPGYFDSAGAPQGEVLECAKIMKQFMQQTLTNHRGETFQMKSESQVGLNWSPQKKDNPFGLRTV